MADLPIREIRISWHKMSQFPTNQYIMLLQFPFFLSEGQNLDSTSKDLLGETVQISKVG